MKFGEVQHRRIAFVLTAFAVGVLLAILVGIAIQGFFPQGNNIKKTTTTPPSLATQTLTPTPRETTRKLFGPWHLNVKAGTGAPYLVMLDSGGAVEVSSKAVPIGSNWRVMSPVEIVAEQATANSVKISTGDFNTYTLSYNQAFVFSNQPDAVYGFRNVGPGKAELFGTTVEALKQR
jgi:hypothetical protein